MTATDLTAYSDEELARFLAKLDQLAPEPPPPAPEPDRGETEWELVQRIANATQEELDAMIGRGTVKVLGHYGKR